MSCYNPMIREEDLNTWIRAKDGHKYHPAKIYSTNWLELYDKNWKPGKGLTLIPCGKCIGCRLDYSREWANRGYLESLYYHSYFLTVTYKDSQLHIPLALTSENGITYTDEEEMWKGILVPRDFTNFLKRLRKYLKQKYEIKLRYMGCGEYGSERGRPHFHFILFTDKPLPLEEEDGTPIWYDPEPGRIEGMLYKNKDIDKCWKKGIAKISEANWSTIAYVSRYITKKMGGKEAAETYASKGQIKEFFRSSRKPGIGYQYYEDHKEEIYRYDKILVKRDKESIWETPPKYFDKMYKEEFPEDFEIIQEKRKQRAISQERLKDLATSVTRLEQKQIDKRAKEECTRALTRILD